MTKEKCHVREKNLHVSVKHSLPKCFSDSWEVSANLLVSWLHCGAKIISSTMNHLTLHALEVFLMGSFYIQDIPSWVHTAISFWMWNIFISKFNI